MIKTEESQEMYLKTIYILGKRKSNLRLSDIVAELGYAKSSVSVSIKNLRSRGYVATDVNGIMLTPSGKKKAQKIYERFTVFTEILKKLGVPQKEAEETACRMEHAVTDEVFETIKKKLTDDGELQSEGA